ncbi:MAG: nucleotide sugar dehydrogenase [Actinomycetes bacterium]
MRVAVFGLGYVGSVTAACLAAAGHEVVGVDPVAAKRDALRKGRSPVSEPGLDMIIADAVGRGALRVADDVTEAVQAVDVCVICVGTPSQANGSLDLSYLTRVAEQIGAALGPVDRHVVVAVRSTVLPGTTESVVAPLLERASGKIDGEGFSVAFCPEFLRESTAVEDFYAPPFTVLGTRSDTASSMLTGLLRQGTSPVHVVDPATAEALKYACNAFHAVKVTFANEIGRFCRSVGVDARGVMDIFCEDDQLNVSRRYLRPGFAFGGSCLPKDLRALVHRARHADQDLPLLASLLPSNETHIRQAVDVVLATGTRRVALLGLSFKPGTDDLRESPFVTVAEALLGKGIDLRVYDKAVNPQRLVGANREYMERHLPHLARVLTSDVEEALDGAECVVLATPDPGVATAVLLGPSVPVVDLSGGLDAEQEDELRRVIEIPQQGAPARAYYGVAW